MYWLTKTFETKSCFSDKVDCNEFMYESASSLVSNKFWSLYLFPKSSLINTLHFCSCAKNSESNEGLSANFLYKDCKEEYPASYVTFLSSTENALPKSEIDNW